MLPEETQEAPIKIKLKADKGRFSELVTVDQLILMQEGNVRVLRDVLAMFLLDESGKYYPLGHKFEKHKSIPLPSKDATDIIGVMSIQELNEAAANFMQRVDSEVVPPVSAPD
jgi:hypothetical protein